MKTEVKPRPNQFGGLKNHSTSHYLIEAWTNILECLDEGDTAASIISVDFATAFNSMGHQACIEVLIKAGASNQIVRMLGAFLYHRMSTTKIGNTINAETYQYWKPARDAAWQLLVHNDEGHA